MECLSVFFILLLSGSVHGFVTQGNQDCSVQLTIESSESPIRVGDNVTLRCKACGRKDTFWFKNGKRFGETSRVHWFLTEKVSSYPLMVEGKLKIDKVQKKDSGTFTCYAVDFFTNIMQDAEIKLLVKNRRLKI